MESLVYYLFWAGFVFLLLHFQRRTHAMGEGHGQRGTPEQGLERNPKQLGWTAPTTAVDPVCGKTVQTSAASHRSMTAPSTTSARASAASASKWGPSSISDRRPRHPRRR